MLHIAHYVNTFLSSGAAHGSGDKISVKELLWHHLSDSVLHLPGIDQINAVLSQYLLFGVFDMTITKAVIMMWISALLCMAIFIPVARNAKKSPNGSSSKWVNLWEVLVSFIHDEIVEPNFDHGSDKTAMPYFCTVFFFILFCNLIGLVPGAATATGKLSVTLGLASMTLFGMFLIGTIKQGPLWVITGIIPGGIPGFLLPLMWVIEFLGLFIKPFALMIRLFANMTAGHIVVLVFLSFIFLFQSYGVGVGSVAGALMIDFLELLVAFIQAYIFTALSAMFIGASMHHH